MSFHLDQHTGVLIKKAARLFERVANLNLNDLNITYTQTIFLVRLWERDGQNQKELTISSGLRQPTVLGILNRMERDDLLIRSANKNDRRSHNFFLTSKAKRICKKLEAHANVMQTLAINNFKEQQVEQLNQNIANIIDNLQNFINESEDKDLE